MRALPPIEDWRDYSLSRILHVFPASTFLGPFIEFINTNFPQEDHLFYVMGDNSKYQDISNHTNVITALKSDRKMRTARRLISLIKSSEKVVFHGLFSLELIVLLNAYFLISSRSKRPKMFWRIWGGDLYNDFLYPPSGRLKSLKKIRRSIFLQLKKRLVRHLHGIIAPVQGDYDFAVSKYKTNAKLFMMGAYGYTDRTIFDQALTNSEGYSTPSILLGNSASVTNEHFEALDILEGLKNMSSIRVICPLSYGDKDYAEKVIEYGKARLGESFEPVLTFMKKEEYIKFLASVDIAIMNHRRQQGLGNISILLRLGKKVYLRRETSTFRHFTDLGIKVFDVEDIIKNPEQTFIWSNELAKHNREILFDYFGKERTIHAWRTIFDS